ncbi:hypothetical protein F5X68DRAFT_69129 [Plectosphaerella plurivora]|uniref:Cell wall biogenesis protein Mhp1 n=1 Tax=Plectosphaerella plurivora TaxID=936078 RepID=A0A9P8VH97_9PEZI|nr:hypothetical protein F5X68DRAFT_69129 [Plectosphaerella plurivora]
MEQVHGVDVSWMTHGSSKDKAARSNNTTTRPRAASQNNRDVPRSVPSPDTDHYGGDAAAPTNGSKPAATTAANGNTPRPNGNDATPSKPIPIRAGVKRSDSIEKSTPNGTSPHRRSSWFTNISSKFSSSPVSPTTSSPTPQAAQAAQATPPKDNNNIPPPPKSMGNRNAVLAHGTRNEGDQPYTPAPPSRGQSGFLGVFRRLSSSGGALSPGQKGNHGLVERKVLNVDRHRERCDISQLHQAKLRRVAFSVDVEIAPMPRYIDSDGSTKPAADKTQKRKMAEKSEGEALKNPKTLEDQKENDGVVKATGEVLSKEPEKEGTEVPKPETPKELPKSAADKEREVKKKEKKKKSEDERKARKEKKRKLAEANGTIPMEIHVDDSDSSTEDSRPSPAIVSDAPPKTTSYPTTNPVRIYRRCCQLRETPILKKITEQLSSPVNSPDSGIVEKLDLTGYWLQLPDLITLGDYLAVVPVKEVLLENCGLTDEGLRVILAGLLAAKRPENRRRRHVTQPDGLCSQGGVVERLVLKNNKLGFEGWKHICLFTFLCRSLKQLDLSMIVLPRPPLPKQNGNSPPPSSEDRSPSETFMLAKMLSKAIGQRLGGSTLEVLQIGGINPTPEELGLIIDGVIEAGVRRLGLAHNNLDEQGFQHVSRYLASEHCEGLDLGGNDLRDQMEVLAKAIPEGSPLWCLSVAECNLGPASLCKIFPKLAQLESFRFIDLSHNTDLCSSEPSAIGLLRKYLPKLTQLKRVHLADVAMSSEQAIALAEILPEIQGLAHISLLENPELVKLADATTEEAQEEACALYASLLAATRVSKTIVCLDIDVPSERSGDIVKAMAKQVVAYCLRNLQRVPLSEISSAIQALSDGLDVSNGQEPPYPDVLAHLVGHDVLDQREAVSENELAPDDDYVIGGTGVVKALTCCLKNRGDESTRQSGEFIREVEGGSATPSTPRTKAKMPTGKAKDMSKHLLAGARKIRIRLQPTIEKAKANPDEPEHNLRKLMFLDNTLENIIKRFEDEYPDTREPNPDEEAIPTPTDDGQGASTSSAELDPEHIAIPSDPEDDLDLDLAVRPSLSRSNTIISHSSRALANEEGRMLRTGHKFRSGIIKPEFYDLLNGLDESTIDAKQLESMHSMFTDLADPDLDEKLREKGVVRTMREDRVQLREAFKKLDPEYWERFVESQEKARGNVKVSHPMSPGMPQGPTARDESAVED